MMMRAVRRRSPGRDNENAESTDGRTASGTENTTATTERLVVAVGMYGDEDATVSG